MNVAPRTDKPAYDDEPLALAESIVPRATYRLQLRREFNFQSVVKILPYLSGLGISHLYLSPIFQARPGSAYGYDIINHGAINPELGTLEEFKALSAAARSHGLGIILDIVPNHMAVMTMGNEWWADVLENGPASKFARYFDIDWTPLRESMRNRLLVPVLESRYGDELNAGRIQLRFEKERGFFCVYYGEHCFPIDPQSYPQILAGIGLTDSAGDNPDFLSIVEEFGRLPSRNDISPEQSDRRYRDKEVLKHRLAMLCARNDELSHKIEDALTALNGRTGEPKSLDALARLLDAQPYRLAYWKVAGDEINYRRFFDVNQLAALRADNPDVFAATHELVLGLVRHRLVDGLRVDHIDGLHDPLKYLAALRDQTTHAGFRHCYLVVEKILAAHERLHEDWPVEGTTGYEFNALVTNWLTYDRGVAQLEWTYRQFIRRQPEYGTLVYQSKKLLMRTSLAAEIAVLGVQLDRIAHAHRDTADFTHFALRDALTEVIAAFPVYRTYITDCGAGADDTQSISWAVGAARARGKGSDRSIFDFIQDVLLCKPNTATDPERHAAVIDFTRKFQQVTAPVNAKSVEDTAFYRYFRLLAANEVGGDPRVAGVSTAAFHRTIAERARRWPHTLLATSTHDSKRGEDVRYRLCALTELPRQWRQFTAKMSRLNRSRRIHLDKEPTPTRNDEYLLLQTLVGIWPASIGTISTASMSIDSDIESTIDRLKQYAIKAVREAKECTSWIDPDLAYEAAVLEFIDGYVAKARRRRLLALLKEIVEPVAFFGALNALSATVLKLTLPGVPDFYQGSELNELSLVDPDNRRAVDFERRLALCERLLHETANDQARCMEALQHWADGELKFFVIWRLLQLRREQVALFAQAGYEPLEVQGTQAAHVCAFVRPLKDRAVIVVVARWMAALMNGTRTMPIGSSVWSDTRITLPASMKGGTLLNVLPQSKVSLDSHGVEPPEITAAELFTQLPIAVVYWTADASDGIA